MARAWREESINGGETNKMSEKVESDLEKLNRDRKKAEEAYLVSMDRKLEVERIRKEGISSVEDLIAYIDDIIESVQHSEDLARMSNNPIVYSEAIGIRREMTKLLNLVFMDGTAAEHVNGTEEKHREENTGEEGYV